MRIALAQINPTVGDLRGNLSKILSFIKRAKAEKAEIVLFPELSLSGYPPEDLLLQPHFIHSMEESLNQLIEASNGITVIVGIARINPHEGKPLLNSAAILQDGALIGFQDKSLLPTYDVFNERRYFEPAKTNNVWDIKGKKVGITICEDIWKHGSLKEALHYPDDPIQTLSRQNPDFILNLSASPFSQKKSVARIDVCKKVAKTVHCPVLLCNQVGANDSLIFDGHSLCVHSSGALIHYAKGFEEDLLLADLNPPKRPIELAFNPTKELYQALILGIKDYFHKQQFQTACLGISGGIDSAVVACLAEKALGKDKVTGLFMPSRFSSKESEEDALALIHNLKIPHEVLSIEKPFQCFLNLLHPLFKNHPFDTTEENLQARIRGMLLMAFSNKFGSLVLSTGNKSEIALGYCTLYGDLCGGLSVISDVAKQQVYELARFINQNEEIIPKRTLLKAPSAELRNNQKDSDSLPDYAIVDRVLSAYVEEHLSPEEIAHDLGYSLDLVNSLIKKIHQSEYKRRQSPPGLKVTSRAFSVGRHFPIVQRWV